MSWHLKHSRCIAASYSYTRVLFSLSSRAVPFKTESLEPLYLFVLSHFPTRNRFTLLARKCSKGKLLRMMNCNYPGAYYFVNCRY
ncbi:hypothetical protein BKD03_11705 [Brucella sp. 09RB8471]|nr:hypothetical protein BKD03_11705 [Brucella sp. 09RB8471]